MKDPMIQGKYPQRCGQVNRRGRAGEGVKPREKSQAAPAEPKPRTPVDTRTMACTIYSDVS